MLRKVGDSRFIKVKNFKFKEPPKWGTFSQFLHFQPNGVMIHRLEKSIICSLKNHFICEIWWEAYVNAARGCNKCHFRFDQNGWSFINCPKIEIHFQISPFFNPKKWWLLIGGIQNQVDLRSQKPRISSFDRVHFIIAAWYKSNSQKSFRNVQKALLTKCQMDEISTFS